MLYIDIGRGLIAMKLLKPGDIIIALPENLLITSGSVLNSSFGQVLCRFVNKCGIIQKYLFLRNKTW